MPKPKRSTQSPAYAPSDAVPLVSLYRELAMKIERLAESSPSVAPYGTGAITLARRLVLATDTLAQSLADHGSVPATCRTMLLGPAAHGAPLPPAPVVAERLHRYARELLTRYAPALSASGIDTRTVAGEIQ
jgi:hypothetical protein